MKYIKHLFKLRVKISDGRLYMRFIGYEQSLVLKRETICYVKMFALRICQLNTIYSS